MCRASVGRRFCEDKGVRSPYNKTRIMPYYAMFNHPVRDVTSSQSGDGVIRDGCGHLHSAKTFLAREALL